MAKIKSNGEETLRRDSPRARTGVRKIMGFFAHTRKETWGSSRADRSTKGLRARWNRRYQLHDPTRFNWYDESPQQLVALMGGGHIPEGPALDLGCGVGVATDLLATVRRTVGLDISEAVIPQAIRRAADHGVQPMWVIGATPSLPFRQASFGFLFERGTMHQLSSQVYSEHLEEVARVLRPGGLAQLLEGGNACDDLAKQCPHTLRVETFEHFDLPMRNGGLRPMIHALLRRVESPLNQPGNQDEEIHSNDRAPTIPNIEIGQGRRRPGYDE